MVGDSNTADDLFQEAAVIMLQKREQVGADGNFLAWGRAIAFNVVRDYRKKRARQKVHALWNSVTDGELFSTSISRHCYHTNLHE